MERLSGLDAGFLYMETPSWHQHTLKIGIVDASTSPGGYSFAKAKEELGRRLHLLPPFRRRVVPIPGDFHHPVWIDDPDFDIERHVFQARLPAPGGDRELDDLIGQMASQPLRRDRPLWEMWVVEGLVSGEVAFVTKVHHSIADGVAASAMLANVMSPDPDPDVPIPVERPSRRRRLPPRWALLLEAFLDHVGQLFRLPALLIDTAKRLRDLVVHQKASITRTPRPILDAPRTIFNGALTPRRSFARASLPFADFREVRRHLDVTVNDVVLAVVGRAVAGWLRDRGELPTRSLLAAVPTSADAVTDVTRLWGNNVSNLFATLATDVADPAAQLQRIHDVMVESKKTQELLGPQMMFNWVQYTPPGPYRWAIRQYSRFRGADRHPPPINVIVSNVPGPRAPLYLAGARLTGLYSVGPILEGVGLNVTVWSYLDQMNFSAITCPQLIGDLHEITDRFRGALDELLEATSAMAG
ncbi:MAG TPA: wax ester/triacylglycerol synthase family O-acyltransferase [Nitriliruptorales bacterium]